MKISPKRMEVLREHIRAESEHDMNTLLAGMTSDAFNDVVGVPKPFEGPQQTAERYRKHWEGFPDFTVRVRRVLWPMRIAWSRRTNGEAHIWELFWAGPQQASRYVCVLSSFGTSRVTNSGVRPSSLITRRCSTRSAQPLRSLPFRTYGPR